MFVFVLAEKEYSWDVIRVKITQRICFVRMIVFSFSLAQNYMDLRQVLVPILNSVTRPDPNSTCANQSKSRGQSMIYYLMVKFNTKQKTKKKCFLDGASIANQVCICTFSP